MAASPGDAALLTTRSPVTVAVQRLVLRSGRARLGRLIWALVYRWIAHAAAIYLTWGERDPGVYVRAGLGGGDFVPGLSDIDLVVVLAEDPAGRGIAAERARRRWRRLMRALPPMKLILDAPRIFDDADLRELVGTSALTYGHEDGREIAARPGNYIGVDATHDRARMLGRPGLYGATADWRPLRGADRRPPERARDPQLRRIGAWLELVYCWRLVFPACLAGTGPRSAEMCVKFVAEPARVWLWLAHRERASGREDALRCALHRLPEEEEALRAAIDLLRSLPDSPDAALAEVLPTLIRLSARIAREIGVEIAAEGVTEVPIAGADPPTLILAGGEWQPTALVGSGRRPPLLPLVDWRSLTWPLPPDESFAPLPDDPGDPAVLGAAGATSPAGPYPAFRTDGLMIFPKIPRLRSWMRAVQCRATDPVSFALADGDRVAMFPNVRGWSAEDAARRAVTEHRACLAGEPGSWSGGDLAGAGGDLGLLLTAARAALFLESVREREPELPLTVTETTRRLAERSSAARVVVEDALGSYREFALTRTQPLPSVVSAMRKLVLELPAYADPLRRGLDP